MCKLTTLCKYGTCFLINKNISQKTHTIKVCKCCELIEYLKISLVI